MKPQGAGLNQSVPSSSTRFGGTSLNMVGSPPKGPSHVAMLANLLEEEEMASSEASTHHSLRTYHRAGTGRFLRLAGRGFVERFCFLDS